MNDLERDVLAHLHANAAQGVDQLGAVLGRPAPEVAAAVESLLAAGHLERDGAKLVPDAASRPTPGLFVATERGDAQPVEVDLADET